jgi:beta-lactam-binding protein with PASTA domain
MRRVAPFVASGAAGVLVAYLIVVYLVFPIDPDVATPVVPSVTGVTFDAAEQKLTQLGFTAERGEVRRARGKAADIVLEQEPPAGMRQRAGSRIVLHVSAPPR